MKIRLGIGESIRVLISLREMVGISRSEMSTLRWNPAPIALPILGSRACRLLPVLALALWSCGCVGRDMFVFPWSQVQADRDSRLEHVTAATFEERVLKSDRPVLVDFYAEWCGPCKRLGPILEDFSKENPSVRVVKVNVDENPELARRYEVQGMPTLVSIRGGQVVSRSTGLVTKEKIKEMTML